MKVNKGKTDADSGSRIIAPGARIAVTKDKLGGNPVKPGWYEARVSMDYKTSKDGKPMASVSYILQGEDPEGKNMAGRKVFDNITLEESTLWKLNSLYKGVTGKDLPEEDYSVDELFQFVKGAVDQEMVSIEVTIEVSKDSDLERNRVKRVHGL